MASTTGQIANSSGAAADWRILSSLNGAIETLTRQIQKQFGGPEALAQTAFFLGDGLQRAFVDSFFDLIQPQRWTPGSLWQMSNQIARQSLHAARFIVPGETSRLSWLELQNKIEVFLLVRDLPSTLQLPSSGPPPPLPELVERAYKLSPFAALWAVEGLGHYYADASWVLKDAPQGLLANTQVRPESLLMLHAGMGLAFATRLLNDVVAASPAAQVRAMVERFVALCKDNSAQGYVGAALESLGLVTRDFNPELVPIVSRQLEETHPDLAGFFWHGAGRALYFSRAYFLPLLRTPWNGIESEASTLIAQLNLMAGLTWAVTLVNMRQPQIMENILRSYIEHSPWKAGFTNGVSSAIVMRQDTTPDAAIISSFCSYRPAGSDPDLVMLWNNLVAAPCEEARRSWPRLRENHLLDQVFKFGRIEKST